MLPLLLGSFFQRFICQRYSLQGSAIGRYYNSFSSTGDWIQSFHTEPHSSPFLFFILRYGITKLSNCPGGAQAGNLPVLVTQSAAITRVDHHSGRGLRTLKKWGLVGGTSLSHWRCGLEEDCGTPVYSSFCFCCCFSASWLMRWVVGSAMSSYHDIPLSPEIQSFGVTWFWRRNPITISQNIPFLFIS